MSEVVRGAAGRCRSSRQRRPSPLTFGSYPNNRAPPREQIAVRSLQLYVAWTHKIGLRSENDVLRRVLGVLVYFGKIEH